MYLWSLVEGDTQEGADVLSADLRSTLKDYSDEVRPLGLATYCCSSRPCLLNCVLTRRLNCSGGTRQAGIWSQQMAQKLQFGEFLASMRLVTPHNMSQMLYSICYYCGLAGTFQSYLSSQCRV